MKFIESDHKDIEKKFHQFHKVKVQTLQLQQLH